MSSQVYTMEKLALSSTTFPLLLLAGVAAYFVLRSKSSQVHYPPGPRGLPLIGNSFDLPREKEWVTYSKWAKEYGQIVSVNHLGQRIIILNDADLEKELFDSRGAIYSDRLVPQMIKLYGFCFSICCCSNPAYKKEWGWSGSLA